MDEAEEQEEAAAEELIIFSLEWFVLLVQPRKNFAIFFFFFFLKTINTISKFLLNSIKKRLNQDKGIEKERVCFFFVRCFGC